MYRLLQGWTDIDHIIYVHVLAPQCHGKCFNIITVELSGSNTNGSFTTAIGTCSRVPNKNSIDAGILVFGIISGISFFILKMLCCVYSLESPQ